MITFLTVLHILVCLFLILVVLLQAGKGGGMGIAFGGGGGSQTVFGSSGAGNFLTRLTSVTAAIFLVTSLGLAHFSSQQDSKRLQRLAEKKQVEKKSDDDRSAKLKEELEKARQSAQKPSVPAETNGAATTATTPTLPPATAVDKAGSKADAVGNTTGKATTRTVGKAGTTSDDAEKPAAPVKKRRVPSPQNPAAKPGGEGAGEAPPAPAPTAPPAAQ
jgi:preprotein translocase subunit SecG